MRDPAPGETVVRAACPHDCPDTCAMLVTVREEQGRRVAVKVAGDPTRFSGCSRRSG
jgi:Molybdopterin oxidoreductase Fe4S4 domain